MRTTLLRFLPLLALFATGCVIEVEDDDDDWASPAGTGGRAGAAGKSGSSTGGRGGSAGASGTAGSAGSAGSAGAGGAGGAEPAAFVRFAHLAPTTEAVDVCLRSLDFSNSWAHADVAGPVFANNANEFVGSPAEPDVAANARDFYFPGVTTYFRVSPPGPWEVRLVPAANASTLTPSCEQAFGGVADLSLDLKADQTLTVALIGERPTEAGGVSALPLGWAPFGEPDAQPDLALGQVINTLTGGAAITLGTFDPISQKPLPLASAEPASVGAEGFAELPLDTSTRYLFLGAPDETGERPLITSLPQIGVTAKAGDVWTFFAAGTAPGASAPALEPQAVACKNLVEGRGLSEASLIATDCIYLNSKVPLPAPAETPLAPPSLGPATRARQPAPLPRGAGFVVSRQGPQARLSSKRAGLVASGRGRAPRPAAFSPRPGRRLSRRAPAGGFLAAPRPAW